MAGVSACLMAFLIGFQGAIQVLGGQVAAIADNAPDHPVQEYVNLLPHWEPDVLETCLVFQGEIANPGYRVVLGEMADIRPHRDGFDIEDRNGGEGTQGHTSAEAAISPLAMNELPGGREGKGRDALSMEFLPSRLVCPDIPFMQACKEVSGLRLPGSYDSGSTGESSDLQACAGYQPAGVVTMQDYPEDRRPSHLVGVTKGKMPAPSDARAYLVPGKENALESDACRLPSSWHRAAGVSADAGNWRAEVVAALRENHQAIDHARPSAGTCSGRRVSGQEAGWPGNSAYSMSATFSLTPVAGRQERPNLTPARAEADEQENPGMVAGLFCLVAVAAVIAGRYAGYPAPRRHGRK